MKEEDKNFKLGRKKLNDDAKYKNPLNNQR